MSSLKKYKRIKYLGKGSYGAAILVELRSDPSKKFVIKEIVIGHLKPAEQASAKSEADVLHQMNHSNITMYVESFVESSKLYIVMEHADGGDLSGAIKKRKEENNYYAEDEVMRIFVQIVLALKHVHAANILHRDLKSQNIFLTLKGMVKLGDFGIAKVLDASDDQARTQIGTPYYLSPEICESKPYGRKSDVWSLGVVLYEIIALEMPFQAQSLPALVHKICSGEPNYKLVETKYSAALIALTKTMLHKNPDKRPSLSQIVKTDFIMSHISRLLSYTLKMGNGGVVNPGAALPPLDAKQLDADEADRNIERERVKQRERDNARQAESKETQLHNEREAKRVDEREKLRKFRQDMAAKNRGAGAGAGRDGDVVNEDSKDGRNNGRGRSPVRGASPVRNKSPMAGRNGAVSPARGRSPLAARGGAASPRRGNSPVREGESPTPAARKQYSEQSSQQQRLQQRVDERQQADVRPAPRITPQQSFPSQLQQVQASRGGGGNSSAPPAKSMGEYQAEKQQERQRQIDALRRGGDVAGGGGGGGYNREGRNSNDGRGPSEASARLGGGQRQQSQDQLIPQAQYQQQQQQHEDPATAEYLRVRQAAQAHKARVEADLHGGNGERMSIISGQPAGSRMSGGHIRRNSESESVSSQRARAGSENEGVSGSYDGRGGNGLNEAEQRIAMLREQKEKDKARQIMQEQMQLKQAMEANREEKRAVQQQNRGAVAFSVDFDAPRCTPPPLRNHRLSESKDNSPIAPKVRQPNHLSRDVSAASVEDEADCTYGSLFSAAKSPPTVKENTPPLSGAAGGGSGAASAANKKKGWGQPIDPSEVGLAKGVARYNGSSKTPSNMFEVEPPSSHNNNRMSDAHVGGGGGASNDSRMSLDTSVDSDAPNDSEVRRFLANKRASQMDARMQAKEVFRKLREQKQKEAETKTKVRVVRKTVSVGGNESKQTSAVTASPARKARIMDVLNSVELASQEVQKGLAAAGPKYRTHQSLDGKSPVKGSIGGADSKESKVVTPVDDAAAAEADDLQDTLQHWLSEQKRGVTTRRKHHHHSRGGGAAARFGLDDDDDVKADAVDDVDTSVVAATTADSSSMKSSSGVNNGSNSGANSDGIGMSSQELLGDEDGGGGLGLGNDVEVVDMQCMLAKALMRETDSDDDTEGEGDDDN